MSVEERVEYITYLEGKVIVEKSIRYYDENGELISSGLIAEEVEIPEGGKPEDAIERARRRLRERLEDERRRWAEELKRRRERQREGERE